MPSSDVQVAILHLLNEGFNLKFSNVNKIVHNFLIRSAQNCVETKDNLPPYIPSFEDFVSVPGSIS